jgi:hypothetical protein
VHENTTHEAATVMAVAVPKAEGATEGSTREAEDAEQSQQDEEEMRKAEEADKDTQGRILHLFVAQEYPKLAGKLTGMLLELSADKVRASGAYAVRSRHVWE